MNEIAMVWLIVTAGINALVDTWQIAVIIITLVLIPAPTADIIIVVSIYALMVSISCISTVILYIISADTKEGAIPSHTPKIILIFVKGLYLIISTLALKAADSISFDDWLNQLNISNKILMVILLVVSYLFEIVVCLMVWHYRSKHPRDPLYRTHKTADDSDDQ